MYLNECPSSGENVMRCPIRCPSNGKGCRYEVPSMPPLSQRVPFPVEKMGCSAVRKHNECPNRFPSNGEVILQWIECDPARVFDSFLP